jgi:hypothetical protein
MHAHTQAPAQDCRKLPSESELTKGPWGFTELCELLHQACVLCWGVLGACSALQEALG